MIILLRTSPIESIVAKRLGLFKTTSMRTQIIPEHELNSTQRKALQSLLGECFPEFLQERIYYKQLPQFRYLVWEGPELVAQMGVEHRMISLGETPVRIFGVIDLCTTSQFRKKGIAAKLLEELHVLAKSSGVDFILLFADDFRLYQRVGFKNVSNHCRWLGINEHKMNGVHQDSLKDSMMIVNIGKMQWSDGPVDMLGYLF